MPIAKETFSNDVRYSAWANQRLLALCARLPSEDLHKDLGASHASIVATLGHIYDGERVWLDCLRSEPALGPWQLPPGPAPEFSMETLIGQWPRLWEGYRQFLENSSDLDLSVEMIVQLPDNVELKLPRWKILRHVMNHSTLHRGQIISMIRNLGHQPLNVDLTTYYVESQGKRLRVESAD